MKRQIGSGKSKNEKHLGHGEVVKKKMENRKEKLQFRNRAWKAPNQ